MAMLAVIRSNAEKKALDDYHNKVGNDDSDELMPDPAACRRSAVLKRKTADARTPWVMRYVSLTDVEIAFSRTHEWIQGGFQHTSNLRQASVVNKATVKSLIIESEGEHVFNDTEGKKVHTALDGRKTKIETIPLREIENVRRLHRTEDQSKSMQDLMGSSAHLVHAQSVSVADRTDRLDLKEGDDMEFAFMIETIPGGLNSGRATTLRASSEEEYEAWVEAIERARLDIAERDEAAKDTGPLSEERRLARAIFESNSVQYFIGLAIFLAYVQAIAAAQALPQKGSVSEKWFFAFECLFTAVFTFELFLNAFGNWWRPFVSDWWNWFDTVVVAVCIVSAIVPGLPAVNVLRLLRVFKMVRLFRKLTALRILLNALSSSVVPVLYSFMILLLVSSLYAVLSTDLFGGIDFENFGSFMRSLFSLFQIATGDSWASVIVRGVMTQYEPDMQKAGLTGLFFVSYVLIVGIVLINVVVAVLLDEFISTVAREKLEDEMAKTEHERTIQTKHAIGPLDPLISGIMDYTSQGDLSDKIMTLYQRFDINEGGGIDFDEFNKGLTALNLPQITKDEWEVITDKAMLLDARGELMPGQFEAMIKQQLHLYCRRRLVSAMFRCRNDENNSDLLLCMQLINTQLEALQTIIVPDPARVDQKKKQGLLKTMFCGPMVKCFAAWKEWTKAQAAEAALVPIYQVQERLVDMEQTLDSVSENQKSLEANMSSVMRSVREMHNLLAANLNLPKGSLPGALPGAPSHGQLQGALADVRPDPMQHTYSNPPSDASRAKGDLVFVHAEKEVMERGMVLTSLDIGHLDLEEPKKGQRIADGLQYRTPIHEGSEG